MPRPAISPAPSIPHLIAMMLLAGHLPVRLKNAENNRQDLHVLKD
jgi:hypothetical protein